MKRREFIIGLGGAAAWPVAARAQQRERMRRVGILMNLAADDPVSIARATAFAQGLQELKWIAGRNVQIVYRWAAGKADLFDRYAAELIALAPDVIVPSGGAAVWPVLQATRTIPVVFVIAPDPVGNGYVASLSRPGGNATGFMMFEYNLAAKWVNRYRPGGRMVIGHSSAEFHPITPFGVPSSFRLRAVFEGALALLIKIAVAYARWAASQCIAPHCR